LSAALISVDRQGCAATLLAGLLGVTRRIEGLTVLDYPMSRGALAGYYPELNPLLPLDYYDRISGTPAAKSIPQRMRAQVDVPA
jgi:formate dehydrogenase major subunit